MTKFEQDIKDFLNKVKKTTHMNILVWGPGDPGPTGLDYNKKAYAKRLQIKDVLKATFDDVDVFFSEDPEMRVATDLTSNELLREAIQVEKADIIIVLDVSRGTNLELDHYILSNARSRDKFHVFIHQNYFPVTGLVKSVFDKLSDDQIEGFSDDDFDKCSLATKKAVNAVHACACRLALQF